MGLVTIITFMFAINDVETLLDSPTGQPWAQLIWNITGSKAATIVLILVMMVMVSWRSARAHLKKVR
jgi:hypothetical protein